MWTSWPSCCSGRRDSGDQLVSVGIAQGQFAIQNIIASFRKQKLKPTLVRTDKGLSARQEPVTFFESQTQLPQQMPDLRQAELNAGLAE